MDGFSFYIVFMKGLLITFGVLLAGMSFGQDTLKLNEIVDTWHESAADADFDMYFGVLTEDFVFLGTAPGERWAKEEFASFCKPYFDKGRAWSFIPSNRHWMFSSNKKIAWFDEDIDTWMRGCRGSGILIKEKGKWKIAYYNLTVLIENEKIEQFIELRDQPIEQD